MWLEEPDSRLVRAAAAADSASRVETRFFSFLTSSASAMRPNKSPSSSRKRRRRPSSHFHQEQHESEQQQSPPPPKAPLSLWISANVALSFIKTPDDP